MEKNPARERGVHRGQMLPVLPFSPLSPPVSLWRSRLAYGFRHHI